MNLYWECVGFGDIKWVTLYAKDDEAFFKDFAVAFGKLLELGVPFPTA
ncbi:hypothetical protein TSOC_002340 [Tetrabaena socialis]|uniref:Uncharacterized protein n=1 Tax=Tetrabaena socialis TaxID=47790 RepID=A0A2J8AE99_9CHLO|nr:hypothetical protein TSOC_002340 [Tetrabaena socialis]|eukprot:PNH10843.1 hypothetical protein TSOC_002340 [Tetrabaena socialis]